MIKKFFKIKIIIIYLPICFQQECIPIGCVPTASVAVFPACTPPSMHGPFHTCPPSHTCPPQPHMPPTTHAPLAMHVSPQPHMSLAMHAPYHSHHMPCTPPATHPLPRTALPFCGQNDKRL